MATDVHKKLSTEKRGLTRLRFPENVELEGTGNVMRFSINLPSGSTYLENERYKKAYDKEGNLLTSVYRRLGNKAANLAGRFSDNYVRTETQIDLYMPPQIQSSYTADWGADNLGIAGSLSDAYFGLSNTQSWTDAEQSWKAVKNTIKESGIKTLTSAVQAITPINLESLRKAATSTLENPYTEVLFNGIQNRTFSFTFKFIPKNASEQRMVKNIIREFKFHQAPEVKYDNQSNYWLFPSEFDIKFLHRNSENPWLFKISTCALTNVVVNYSPENQYASHADGSPFATELTLSFTELEVLTKERLDQGDF